MLWRSTYDSRFVLATTDTNLDAQGNSSTYPPTEACSTRFQTTSIMINWKPNVNATLSGRRMRVVATVCPEFRLRRDVMSWLGH
jgi:hypothetical protein